MVSGKLIGGGTPARSECLVSIYAVVKLLNDQFSTACPLCQPLSLEIKPRLVASTHDADDISAKPTTETGQHVGIYCIQYNCF